MKTSRGPRINAGDGGGSGVPSVGAVNVVNGRYESRRKSAMPKKAGVQCPPSRDPIPW